MGGLQGLNSKHWSTEIFVTLQVCPCVLSAVHAALPDALSLPASLLELHMRIMHDPLGPVCMHTRPPLPP